MSFNLFGRPYTARLTADDLDTLIVNEVREGYVVEYKGEFPKNDKIARSLAALANTQGGWYFVGVTTDEHHVATAITGFSQAEHRDAVGKIRGIARDRISPVPSLYPQTVPLDPDNNPDRIALAVYVPSEQETPFFVQGTIYRRTHDSTDPVAESDRYAVDRLVDAGRKAAGRFERFCMDNRAEHPRMFRQQGWVSLYF